MNGQAPAGGTPARAASAAPPTASTIPISAKPTSRSGTACAREFQIACSKAEKRAASTIDRVTGRLLGSDHRDGTQEKEPSGLLSRQVWITRSVLASLGPVPAALIVNPGRTTGGTLGATEPTLHRAVCAVQTYLCAATRTATLGPRGVRQ